MLFLKEEIMKTIISFEIMFTKKLILGKNHYNRVFPTDRIRKYSIMLFIENFREIAY